MTQDVLKLVEHALAVGALFDVREAGEIHDGHISGATALPRRMIELRVRDLVAARDTPITVYDEGGSRAAHAAQTLARLGYTNVSVLDGGTRAWREAGAELVQGKNVPSKAYAEQMFEELKVPQVTAETLHEWRRTGKKHVLYDIRSPEEHRLGYVPGAVNVPGVEVVAAAADLERNALPVVVHCAGRTRSILACQTLRELGVGEVYALKNGTMGWTLAGFELERNAKGQPDPFSEASKAAGLERSRALAHAAGATPIAVADLTVALERRAQGKAECYVFDVRQTPQYETEHIAGALSLPGGQAVLFADDHVAVRTAEIVFVDDGDGRADLTAFWFRKLGYPRVRVLEGGLPAWRAAGGAVRSGKDRTAPALLKEARAAAAQIDPAALVDLMKSEPSLSLLDVNTSKNFAKGHIDKAQWLSRGWLEERAPRIVGSTTAPIAVVCQNGIQSAYAGATLKALGYSKVSVLAGGLQAWSKAGLPLVQGAPRTADDVVKSPYERTREDMVNYLKWEEQLVNTKSAERGQS